MAGPNWRSCLGSLLLLVVPTIVFLIWVASYMGQKVSWAIFVISCILPCLCVTWLLLTACTDPGVLPRQEPDEEWLSGRKPRTKEVIVNGHPVQVRYNDTCHFYQPPRAHHCSVNDNCIERFDHHCPWVGTTIGKRNYRTFLLFIYGSTIYIMWTFGISLWSFWVKAKDLEVQTGKAPDILAIIAANPAAVALCVVCFIFFWFVGGLSGFHTFLVASNQTTYENFSNQRRHSAGGVTNPYDRGLLRNCTSVWCAGVPPPKIDYRAFVGEARKAQASAGPSFYGPSDDGGDAHSLDGQRASASGGGNSCAAASHSGGPTPGGEAMPQYTAGVQYGGGGSAGLAAPEHVALEMVPPRQQGVVVGDRQERETLEAVLGDWQQQQTTQQRQRPSNGEGGRQQ